jgi:hypothetical protein
MGVPAFEGAIHVEVENSQHLMVIIGWTKIEFIKVVMIDP